NSSPFAHQPLNTYPQQQQQQQYQQQQQQQQHGFSSQAYPHHLQLHHGGITYPLQRQRHSSQNSAASHHTMGLGPIGGGPGSAGGSVNSDEVSTEEDSDEVFDEMRNRQRMQSAQSSLFQQPSLMQQGFHQSNLAGGYEGYSSHNSSSSSLLNRRGSAGSTHSIGMQHQHQQHQQHQQQQQGQQQFYLQKSLDYSSQLSHGSIDLYGQNALVSSMEKHSINGGSGQPESDLGISGGRLLQGRFGNGAGGSSSQSRQSSGSISNAVGSGLAGVSAGSRFEDDHGGFFSNGFGGIIGEGAHGYGQVNGSSMAGLGHYPSSVGGAFSQSIGVHQSGGYGFGSFGGSVDTNGVEMSDGRTGRAPGSSSSLSSSSGLNSSLSASAAPFYLESSSLHYGQQPTERVNDASRVVGWDR
ncbi:hypothetical protein BGZ99_003788, partial [Dissophora globulifera]